MGGKAFKWRLVHSVALTIYGLKQLCTAVKTYIANVLKCKARLKFKCVCIIMLSLVMSPFSCDFIKAKIDLFS